MRDELETGYGADPKRSRLLLHTLGRFGCDVRLTLMLTRFIWLLAALLNWLRCLWFQL